MSKDMIPKVAVAVVFVVTVGLLTVRRFDTPPQDRVVIVTSQGSAFQEDKTFKRGDIIETGAGEHLLLQIGNDILLGIDERSRVELHRLFLDERTLKFTKGRIEVVSKSQTPIFIETNKTINILENGRGVFINYDFQQLVTIAPIIGSIQTQIKGRKDFLLIPVALNVSETDPVSFSKTAVERSEGPSAAFHAWFDANVNQ